MTHTRTNNDLTQHELRAGSQGPEIRLKPARTLRG